MNRSKFLAIALIAVVAFSCKKNNSNSSPSTTPNASNTIVDSSFDDLSDEDASYLESLPDTTIELQDIIFEDGESVYDYLYQNDSTFLNTYGLAISRKAIKASHTVLLDHKGLNGDLTSGFDQKKLFVSLMIGLGKYFSNREYFRSVNGQENGLGYLSGSKDYNIPAFPTGPGDQDPVGCLNQKSYGLDCSGFFYQLTMKSDLPEIVHKGNFGVGPLTNVDVWTNAFARSFLYKKLYMTDIGKLSAENIALGDIIMWKNGSSGHMGFCTGRWVYECGGHWKEPDCRSNKTNDSGPKLAPLTKGLLNQIDKGNYTVYRIRYRDDSTTAGSPCLIDVMFNVAYGPVSLNAYVDGQSITPHCIWGPHTGCGFNAAIITNPQDCLGIALVCPWGETENVTLEVGSIKDCVTGSGIVNKINTTISCPW
jgi:hypothetical protein